MKRYFLCWQVIIDKPSVTDYIWHIVDNHGNLFLPIRDCSPGLYPKSLDATVHGLRGFHAQGGSPVDDPRSRTVRKPLRTCTLRHLCWHPGYYDSIPANDINIHPYSCTCQVRNCKIHLCSLAIPDDRKRSTTPRKSNPTHGKPPPSQLPLTHANQPPTARAFTKTEQNRAELNDRIRVDLPLAGPADPREEPLHSPPSGPQHSLRRPIQDDAPSHPNPGPAFTPAPSGYTPKPGIFQTFLLSGNLFLLFRSGHGIILLRKVGSPLTAG